MKAKTSYYLKLISTIAGLGLMFWGIYTKAILGAIGVPLFIYGISPRKESELTVNISHEESQKEPPQKVA